MPLRGRGHPDASPREDRDPLALHTPPWRWSGRRAPHCGTKTESGHGRGASLPTAVCRCNPFWVVTCALQVTTPTSKKSYARSHRGRPCHVGLRRGSGVVIAAEPGPHRRARAAPRRGHRHVPRRADRDRRTVARRRRGPRRRDPSVDTGDIAPVAWGRRRTQLGTPVLALANPGGHGLRATFGFVSSTGRSLPGSTWAPDRRVDRAHRAAAARLVRRAAGRS